MENTICLDAGYQGVILFRFLTVFRTVYTANNEYGCGDLSKKDRENTIYLDAGCQGEFLFRFLTVFRTVYTAINEYGCGNAGLNVATETH